MIFCVQLSVFANGSLHCFIEPKRPLVALWTHAVVSLLLQTSMMLSCAPQNLGLYIFLIFRAKIMFFV